jgi:hypothetical protein
MMGLIGCCAIHSFFPMRFSNEQTLREVLRTVWQTYLEDMKHLVPGQNLKPISNQARAAGVFLGTEFNYLLSAPPEPPADASRANFSLPLEEDGSAFPLRVCFYESEHGLAWSVRYRSAQLEDETVERVSIRVGQILARMTQDVDVRLDNMKC